MTTVTAEEARNQFSDIISRVAYAKEHVVLTRRGKKVAAIVSIEDLELLEKLIEEAEDHLDIAAAAEALEEIEREGTVPWEQVKAEQER